MQDAGDYKIALVATTATTATASPTPRLTPASPLEPFLLLAKNAIGAGAAHIIHQATQTKGIISFQPLLLLPSIQALKRDPTHSQAYHLLHHFTYHTYIDYDLAPLSPLQAIKLKQLTILTLAKHNRIIPYHLLLESLQLESVQALEDLVIEAFYQGFLVGKLDQKQSRLEIISCEGRDVAPLTSSCPPFPPVTIMGELNSLEPQTPATLLGSLKSFQSTLQTVLSSLDLHLARIQAEEINQLGALNRYEQELNQVVLSVQGVKGTIGAGGGEGGGRKEVEGWSSVSGELALGGSSTSGSRGMGKLVEGDEMQVDEQSPFNPAVGAKERKSKRGRK